MIDSSPTLSTDQRPKAAVATAHAPEATDAIVVQSLSKLYRLGARSKRAETALEAVTQWISAPLRNLRELNDRPSLESAAAARAAVPSGDTSNLLVALDDLSFRIKRGGIVGVIGRNGAGKSTLLKILARITSPTAGEAVIQGRVGSLLEVGTGFHPDLTGRENVFLNGTMLGMSRLEIDERLDRIVEFSGVGRFLDTPVKRYSSGMRVRLGFSVAAHLEPEILLVDEVLAVGDAEFQAKCLGKMSEVSHLGRTVLFVSHNMDAILNLCEECLVLEAGKLAFRGPAADAVDFYMRSFARSAADGSAHEVRGASGHTAGAATRVDRIEFLHRDGSPKSLISTWDDLVVRIHYRAAETYAHGSFILDVFDRRQQRLLVMDSGTRIPIRAGQDFVDCAIPRLPLAAGDFFIGVGLALSNNQWLWREQNFGTFHVHGRDVFQIGRPPDLSRMVFAADHQWIPSSLPPAS